MNAETASPRDPAGPLCFIVVLFIAIRGIYPRRPLLRYLRADRACPPTRPGLGRSLPQLPHPQTFRADRRRARALVEGGDFIEIHCAADLGVCEQRDTKGLYAKARAGQIKDFTGISSPYEEPEAPELRIDTGSQSLEESVAQVLTYLESQGVVPAAGKG